jgi:type II secretory pathway component GspD/PulD (secretin)
MVISTVAFSADSQADRQKIVEQLAARWMQIGQEQYERGYYKAAEQSFLKAKDYEQYLGSAQRERLGELLEQAHTAAAASEKVSGDIAQAQDLLAQGRLAEARTLFMNVRNNPYLTAEMKKIVEQGLAATGDQAAARQAEMEKLYSASVDYYNAGQLEKARAGFLEVAKSGLTVGPADAKAEDYLAKIDAALAKKAAQQPVEKGPQAPEVEKELFGAAEVPPPQMPAGANQPEVAQPPVEAPAVAPPSVSKPVAQAQPQQPAGGYIEAVKRRENILRSHTEAVVNDALAKARSYQSQNEFDQANKAVEYAQNVVNKNRLPLGEETFGRYNDELQKMRDQLSSAESAYKEQVAQTARVQAQQEHQKVREEMAAERKKRVEELMNNALAYQKQQRYSDALGQLQSLIAIDPLNQQALIMKDTLEDTIAFQDQLKTVKEQQRERADLMLETSKSEIPYAKEMTVPKDWLEISKKRVPEKAIGQDPATAKVYEQLDQIVNLSELSHDMPFGEALDVFRNSVDPPLKIVPLWRDLYDNADIDQSTPINMDPISSVRLGSALKFLLEAVSGGFAELDYGVDNGVITIATKASLPANLVTLVYDVSDLVGLPAEYRTSVTTNAGATSSGVANVVAGFASQGQGEQEYNRSTVRQERQLRINDLMALIRATVAPDTWDDVGGEGTITSYGLRMLSIRQTANVHNQVASLLKELRKSHGYQVAIETRFLKVRENFLEDIGLDVDMLYNPGGKWSQVAFTQNSGGDLTGPGLASVAATGVEGSLAGMLASTLSGGYGTILDDLQVSFVLRATQAHDDATLITAPKATVLSGEDATFRVQQYLFYPGNIQVQTAEAGANTARGFATVNYQDRSVVSGTILNIMPTIAPDKKHVLLNIDAVLSDFLGFRNQTVELPVFGEIPGANSQYTIQFPQVEAAQVSTRVSVPDGGTLLLGGQKLGAEENREVGVPVLSKIPVLGRAFDNRSKVKDHKILLILVKPTIVLQEEVENEAVAEMQKNP